MNETGFDLLGLVKRLLQKPDQPPRVSSSTSRYRAVEICFGKNPCAAARVLGEQRFLAKDAPRLPLPSCTAARCDCSFTHLLDRRDEGRRAEDHARKQLFSGHDARSGLERRRDDHDTRYDDQYFDPVNQRRDEAGD